MMGGGQVSMNERMSWWEVVGRVSVLILAYLLVTAVIAVVALYWPDIHKFIANSFTMAVLTVLVFVRRR